MTDKAESLRDTIRRSWDKKQKTAKSQSLREFDAKRKSKVSKGGYNAAKRGYKESVEKGT